MENQEYKTPSYMRKCYKRYYDNKKSDEDFKKARREAQKRYYHANKEKVLEKLAKKRADKKAESTESTESNSDLESNVSD